MNAGFKVTLFPKDFTAWPRSFGKKGFLETEFGVSL